MAVTRAFLAVLPAILGSWWPAGILHAQFEGVAQAVEEGIRQGVYPGAVVMIGRSDTVLYAKGFGHFTWSQSSLVPDPETTLWDLASLTKVVATTSAAMRLVDRGALYLETPVKVYLPQFSGAGKDRVTLRMLLDHTSGLPGSAPLYRGAADREAAIANLWQVELRRSPGARAEYSDLNAILLGLVLEAVTKTSFSDLIRQEVLDPLGMLHTLFAPPVSMRRNIAPSLSDRQGPIAGRASDPNAFAMGGIAGHAGLFSTGRDLARFAQAWLRGGAVSQGSRWVSSGTMGQFLTKSTRSGTRVLGWDSPSLPSENATTSFGALANIDTFGHTGWSGTSIWIDPVSDLFVVLLTNRSYQPKVRQSLTAIRDVRHAVSDAARESFLAQCGGGVVQIRC